MNTPSRNIASPWSIAILGAPKECQQRVGGAGDTGAGVPSTQAFRFIFCFSDVFPRVASECVGTNQFNSKSSLSASGSRRAAYVAGISLRRARIVLELGPPFFAVLREEGALVLPFPASTPRHVSRKGSAAFAGPQSSMGSLDATS